MHSFFIASFIGNIYSINSSNFHTVYLIFAISTDFYTFFYPFAMHA